MTPDTVAIVDWSAGARARRKPRADALWSAVVRDGSLQAACYYRDRARIEAALCDLIEAELTAGRRLFLGLDFPFGYPAGFGDWLTGSPNPLAVWDWLEARIVDGPKQNNRFDVAAQINAGLDGIGPFWGNPLARDIDHLPRKGRSRTCTRFPERREAETRLLRAFPVWQLSGAGAVGSQVLTGLPVLARLRRAFPGQIAVWPFEPLDRPVALVEVWPSLLARAVTRNATIHPIKDTVQVVTLARAIARLPADELAAMLATPACAEGWIFGIGHETALDARA